MHVRFGTVTFVSFHLIDAVLRCVVLASTDDDDDDDNDDDDDDKNYAI